MIAVAADQVAAVAVLQLGERGIGVEVLPAGNAVHHHEAQLVAGVHERGRVRVVREPDVVEPGLLDLPRVAVLGRIRQRVADVGILLVPVGAAQEHPLAVDAEAVLPRWRSGGCRSRERLGVDHLAPASTSQSSGVQVGRAGLHSRGALTSSSWTHVDRRRPAAASRPSRYRGGDRRRPGRRSVARTRKVRASLVCPLRTCVCTRTVALSRETRG